MSKLLIGESLRYGQADTPTREGEVINYLEEIYNIPTPFVGMRVYCKQTGKEYVIKSLKDETIGDVNVPNAAVDKFEEVVDLTVVHEELDKTLKYTNTEFNHLEDAVELECWDSANKKHFVASIFPATTETAGVMSAEDKEKLDSIEREVNIEQLLTQGYYNTDNVKLDHVWFNGSLGSPIVKTFNSADLRHVVLSVSPGMKFNISAKGGSTGVAYYIADISDIVIDLAEPSATYENHSLIIPENGYKLIVQSNLVTLFSVEYEHSMDIRFSRLEDDINELAGNNIELLDVGDKFDENTIIDTKTGKIGNWEKKGSDVIVTKETDNSIKVVINNTASSTSLGIWLLNYPSAVINISEKVVVSFDIRNDIGVTVFLNGQGDSNKIFVSSNPEWTHVNAEKIIGNSYSDYRILIGTESIGTFYIKNLSIKIVPTVERALDKANKALIQLDATNANVKDLQTGLQSTNALLNQAAFKESNIPEDEWSIGSYSASNGSISANSNGNRIGTKDVFYVNGGTLLKSNGYAMNVAYYGEDGITYNRDESDNNWSTIDRIWDKDGYIRIILKKSDDSVISTDDKTILANAFTKNNSVIQLVDIALGNSANNTDAIQVLQGQTNLLNSEIFIDEELIETKDRLDINTVVDNTAGTAGAWTKRFPATTLEKDTIDNAVKVTFAGGLTNEAFWLLNYENVIKCIGKPAIVSFKYKASEEISFLAAGIREKLLASGNWVTKTITATLVKEYDDYRVMFYANMPAVLYIKDFSIIAKDTSINKVHDELQGEIDDINANLGAHVQDINLALPNLRYKLAQLEYNNTGQLVVGMIGDSWTQHTGASYLSAHTNYAKPFGNYLREHWGDAGGGFYSFGISHKDFTSKMACLDPDDASDVRSTDTIALRSTITYRDQVEGCRWIDATDNMFHSADVAGTDTGASLTLRVQKPHDALIIHFYTDSESSGTFSYKLDSNDAVEVDCSSYVDGHHTIALTGLSMATHTLVFNQISGSSMIFGVDMQKSTPGVRVHKLANKGATSTSFVIVDTDTWKDCLQSLNLDTVTILLGTNDGAGSTVIGNNMNTIISNIKDVNQYIDLCIIQPSDNEASKNQMYKQAEKQYAVAKQSGVGFVNLVPLFGSTDQIIAKGTFYDEVHPTFAGGRMISDYLVDKIVPKISKDE